MFFSKMMFRITFITLYILQSVFVTNGQNVQTMPPQDSCVSKSMILQCPNNYVVVVRSASYGVTQVQGSCAYTTGDCIADAMDIMICTEDTPACSIYLTRKRLPQCSDQFADYMHVEFDCVPTSMDDTTKEYNVCQDGTNITSDHGIIKSPGYPLQFQTTTTECFRPIHIPENKTIRLWLSDLFIGSTSTNCADDHLYIVDSVQTFQHCGRKRYAYPYLCSSTVLIQYLIKTYVPTYRGMRMYFEIVDRATNDNCPNSNGTVTPVPATTPLTTTVNPDVTTTAPTYVILGVASPLYTFQLCKGKSRNIQCPNTYVVTIITNIFGTTLSDECEQHDASKHCAITTEPTFMCRDSCPVMYSGNQVISSCDNKTAAYQYVEYQCIPTTTELVSPNTPCPTDGSKTSISIKERGRFQSYNYPILTKMNCTYRLTTKTGFIMRIYALDLSLNSYHPTCDSNKITFIENDGYQGSDFCEQRSHRLIYTSCSNVLDLVYTVTNDAQLLSYGAELYIESHVPPSDWSCDQSSTIPFVTPTATPLTNETFMGARDEIEHDICYSTALDYTCPKGYTFMIIGAFYGVKKQASNKCGFVQGDCVQEALSTVTQCRHDVPNCHLPYSNQRRLAYCSNNYADYLHITSQCIPSVPEGTGSPVKVYDICDTSNSIADIHGIVTSPSYPDFMQTPNECKRTIVGIQDRILKIWLNEMSVSSGVQRNLNDDSKSDKPDLIIYKNPDINNLNDLEQMYPSIRDTCVNDYLTIDTPHVAYVYCGTRKLAIAPICARSVIVHYKATSPDSSFYKGFKFYFEWVEKPLGVLCHEEPSSGSTTPAPEEPIPDWANNLELSPAFSAHVCIGQSITLRCPRGSDYVLSIIEANYGVTGSGLCEIPTLSHCRQEASLGLTCTHSCFIEYVIPKSLIQCGSENADYINIDYECIPTRLPNNENPIDICASTSTDPILIDTGMIISPQYPSLGAARNCSQKIQTLPSKLWMIFIVDLFIEGENDAGDCDKASLTIYDGYNKIVRCGLHQPEYLLISCSNILEFQFVSTRQALGYRGFKVYFVTVNVPPGMACVPDGFTTTTSTTTPQPPSTTTLVPPSLQISAYGGTTNGTDRYCQFPFIYNGTSQSDCLRTDPPSSTAGQDMKGPWCSLTSNFDNDHQWGFCQFGVTGSTLYEICRSQSQPLRCPPGYVIDILTADYAAKPDGNIGVGACSYDPNDCFQSDAPKIQTTCAGLPSCTVYHLDKTLALCQNRQSAYLHVDYTCVPNDIPEITKYDMCNSSSVLEDGTQRGFIISQNFPNTPADIDCTFNLKTLNPSQDIYLYLVDMDLHGPNGTGQNCIKDRLLVTVDGNVNEMCGISYTNFLAFTCHTSITLQLIRTSDAVGGRGVKFYFELRNKPPHQLCPSLPTTTTLVTLSPTQPTTTTTGPLPIYFPDPSPREIKVLCYPDYSGLLGINNFQCPLNYVLVIHRAFHGKGDRCDYTSGDCTSEADLIYRQCSGKQLCSVSFINTIILPECNLAMANYLFVEYQCLPTLTIVPTIINLCNSQIDHSGISGIFTSLSYPSYAPTDCNNTTLSSLDGSNLVIYMYLLDFDIGLPDPETGECVNDYLLLSYQCNQQIITERLCGAHPTRLLFSTCQPTDQIFASYKLESTDSQLLRGFALLYHLLPKSDTITSIATPTAMPSPTTIHTVTTSEAPSDTNVTSTPIEKETVCVPHFITVKCNSSNYAIVIHKVQLGVSATNSCTYSPTDCFEDHTNSYTYCGGKSLCDIFPSSALINSCNNSKSTYLYVEHQCIPRQPTINLDVCSSLGQTIKVVGGAMITSLDYSSKFQQCEVALQSRKLLGSTIHLAFRIYILSLNLPTRPIPREEGEQCSEADPFIDIDDNESGVTRLCGDSHTRYLLETCSNTIHIRFNNTNTGPSEIKYNGFEIYLESIQNDECRRTPAPIIPTSPFIITKEVACALTDDDRDRVDFGCTPGYGLVFLQSYNFVTINPEQCDVTQHTCFYPSEQPRAQCSGQRECTYTHITPSPPETNLCPNNQPDSVEFYYQCLPMIPSEDFTRYVLGQDEFISTDRGFIETRSYPHTYQQGLQQHSLSIQVPNNTDQDNFSIYLYVLALSIRDTSVLNSSSAIQCYDSLEITDGDTTQPLCGRIDQPLLQYYTNKRELNLTINISQASSSDEWNTWHGARFFFIIGNQSLPSLPMIGTTTPSVDQTSTKPGPGSGSGGLIAAITVVCILGVLALIIGFVYYRRRTQSQAGGKQVVNYDADMVTIDTTDAPNDTRGSVSTASLKQSATTFVNPYFTKLQTIEKQKPENATDA